jgi:glutamyl/glutaminyl-tRNA synthetase
VSAWQWLGEAVENKVPADKRDLFIDVMRQNILFPNESVRWAEIFFGNQLQWSSEQNVILKEAGASFFKTAQEAVQYHKTNLKAILDDLKTKLTISGKKLFMPLRISITGQENGPELAQIVNLLGEEKILQRFQHALEVIEK